MTGVQRLFGNGYTPAAGWKPHRMRSRTQGLGSVSAIVALAVLMAFPPAAAAPSTASVPPGVASYNTGRVSVILPSQLPSIELFQDANNSVSASLQVEGVLELAPGSLPHPTVVAAAFPGSVQGFNGTSLANSTSWPLTLTASLEVRRQNVALWTDAPIPSPLGATVGAAVLSVTYAPLDNGSAGAGVGVQWTIQNWPWVSAGDLLAVEMGLTVSPAGLLTICSGNRPVGFALSACPGPAFPEASIQWGSSYDGLEGGGSTGPIAALSWNDTATDVAQPYTVGAFATGTGAAQLVLGAPAAGASSLEGGVGFALVAPVPTTLASIVADAPVYFATVGVTSAAALAAVVAYRRRERRLSAEL